MALTLNAEQRLVKVGLVEFFEEHRPEWEAAAKRTYDFVTGSFPQGAAVRRDDVAKQLAHVLDVDQKLQDYLSKSKLTQKFWVTYFTDLIVDRVWIQIAGG